MNYRFKEVKDNINRKKMKRKIQESCRVKYSIFKIYFQEVLENNSRKENILMLVLRIYNIDFLVFESLRI